MTHACSGSPSWGAASPTPGAWRIESVRSSSSSWRYLPKLSTGSPLSRRRGSPRRTMGRTLMGGEYTQGRPRPGGRWRSSTVLGDGSCRVVGLGGRVLDVARRVAVERGVAVAVRGVGAGRRRAGRRHLRRSSAAQSRDRSASFRLASVVASAARWASGPGLDRGDGGELGRLGADLAATGAAWVATSLIIDWSWAIHSRASASRCRRRRSGAPSVAADRSARRRRGPGWGSRRSSASPPVAHPHGARWRPLSSSPDSRTASRLRRTMPAPIRSRYSSDSGSTSTRPRRPGRRVEQRDRVRPTEDDVAAPPVARGARCTPAPAPRPDRVRPRSAARRAEPVGHRDGPRAPRPRGPASPTVSLTSRPNGGDPNRSRSVQLLVVERRRVALDHGTDRPVLGPVGLDDRDARPVAAARRDPPPGRGAGRSAPTPARRGG